MSAESNSSQQRSAVADAPIDRLVRYTLLAVTLLPIAYAFISAFINAWFV